MRQYAQLVSTEDAVKVSNRGAAEASFRTAKTVNDAEYSTNNTNWELTNVHLASTASGNKTLTNKLVNSSVENVGSGKLTVSNSANSITDVYATSGNIDIEQLNAAVNLNLSELTVSDTRIVGLYSGTDNGTLSIMAASVPEPTTTTLSLLALAGLAARSRRK